MYTHSHIHYIYVTLLKMILYLKTRFREDRLRLQFGRTMYPDIEWLLQYSCLFDQCLLMKRGFLCNHRICWCGGCYMVTALFISFDDLARYIRILCAISQFLFITINFSWCFSDSPWMLGASLQLECVENFLTTSTKAILSFASKDTPTLKSNFWFYWGELMAIELCKRANNLEFTAKVEISTSFLDELWGLWSGKGEAPL